MRKIIPVISIIFLLISAVSVRAELTVKVRDIASIDGLKENQVFGFGIVMGLQGTGDTKSVLVQSTLKNILKNLDIKEEQKINSKNTAAVLLTAKLPAFVRVGDRVDVNVSSIGDAKSLEGGVVIQSPLRGGDGETYLVCQGSLSISPALKGGKTVKTSGTIVNGGIVEKAIIPDIVTGNTISLVLREWDFSVADSIIELIKEENKDAKPEITNDGKIRIAVPKDADIAKFVSTIENIEVTPAAVACVVVNEKDGTIVMGGDVKVSEVLVSKDGLTIRIEGSNDKGSASVFKEASSVKDIVDSLNYIGASTRDIISILKAIKEAGALHAKLIIN